MSGSTKTKIYITIDTEYSAGLLQSAATASRAANFAHSIACTTDRGDVGVKFQMDVMDRRGVKGVFFVDPMPALLWGQEAVSDIVGPIIARGHDVQLHVHSEWIQFAGAKHDLSEKIGDATGQNLGDFTYEHQLAILDYALDKLIAGGAPKPVAYRAGNYGANDDTLRALASLGLRYDSSHCPGISDGCCQISLTPQDRRPIEHCGVIEVPAGCITNFGGTLRHAQITALSSGELRQSMLHEAAQGEQAFSIVSHSFELLSRDRSKINTIVKRRFENLCRDIQRFEQLETATYVQNPPDVRAPSNHRTLPHQPLPLNTIRSGRRLAEQAISNLFYGGE